MLEHLVGGVQETCFNFNHVLQAADFGIGRKTRGHSRHCALQHLARAVKFMDCRFVKRRHHQTASGVGRQKALAFKASESFARRRTADLEPIGHHVLRQPVARLHLIGGNSLANGLIGHIPKQQVGIVFLFHTKIVA